MRRPVGFVSSTLSLRLSSFRPPDLTATYSRPCHATSLPSKPKRRRCNSTCPPQCAVALPPGLQQRLPALTAAAAAATPFGLWAVLLTAATLGIWSQRYKWAQTLTPPLVATLLTLILSNFGLLPAAHPIYTQVSAYIVPLSIPLILLGADLGRVVNQTGRLLPVFITGSIATCIGTLVAWFLVPLKLIGTASAWKIAAALAARHIGGAVNFIAVADATQAPKDIVTAAITADNVVVTLYFILLLFLARNVSQPTAKETGATVNDEGERDSESVASGPIDIKDAAISLSLSAILCTVARFIDALLPFRLGVIPVVTALIVFVATAIPEKLKPYRNAASVLGIFFLQIFFAVVGAGGSLVSVIQRAPVLLVFSTVQILIHLGILLISAKVFGFHRSHVLLSSNANVGGPATAAAMARAKDWDTLVLPALLVGVFGYSIATFVSLGLGVGVLRFL